jgi:hypothetical protein
MGKHRTADLKGELERYTSAARSGATLATLRQRLGNWPAYAAAAGSALAMATSASAGVISYTGPPVTAENDFDFTHSGEVSAFKGVQIGTAPEFYVGVLRDLQIAPQGRSSQTRRSAVAFGGAGVSQAGRIFHELQATGHLIPRNLGAGQNVSSGAGIFRAGVYPAEFLNFKGDGHFTQPAAHTTSVVGGNWVPGVPGFEGLSFKTAGGQTDYGWAELEIGVDANGFPDAATLLGLEYNTTGGPIETPGAPEPGSASLMLLALGAAGVTALRRHRSSRRKPPDDAF